MLRQAGAKPVRLPRRSPNLNAFIEGHRTIAARSASTRTKEAAMIKNSRMYVGVDLHKSVIQVCVLGSDGTIVSESRHRGSSLKEGLEVVQHLTRWKRVAEVCVESVGMNRWFVNASIEAGLEVIVVDPVKLNLRMLGKKTDRRDAYEIARRLRLGDIERNAQTYYPTEEEYGFRKLLRTRPSRSWSWDPISIGAPQWSSGPGRTPMTSSLRRR